MTEIASPSPRRLLLPAAAPARSGDRVERLLGELADAPGPPGLEEGVRRIVVREVKPLNEVLPDQRWMIIGRKRPVTALTGTVARRRDFTPE